MSRVSWAASTHNAQTALPCWAQPAQSSAPGRDPEMCERNNEGEWRAQEGEAEVTVRRERRTQVCRELSFTGSAAHEEASFDLP